MPLRYHGASDGCFSSLVGGAASTRNSVPPIHKSGA